MKKFVSYKLEADFNVWVKQDCNGAIDITAVHDKDGNFLFDVLEDDFAEMCEKGMIDDESGTAMLYGDFNAQAAQLAAKYGVFWTDTDKKNVIHIDFLKQMKDLHWQICQEIARIMCEAHIRCLDLLGTDADHAVIEMDKYTVGYEDVEVKKVFLTEASEEHPFGEVYVTSGDEGYIEDEIYIAENRYIRPCSVRDLYETVYEEVAKRLGK